MSPQRQNFPFNLQVILIFSLPSSNYFGCFVYKIRRSIWRMLYLLIRQIKVFCDKTKTLLWTWEILNGPNSPQACFSQGETSFLPTKAAPKGWRAKTFDLPFSRSMCKALHPYSWTFSLSEKVSMASNTSKKTSVPSSNRRSVSSSTNAKEICRSLAY